MGSCVSSPATATPNRAADVYKLTGLRPGVAAARRNQHTALSIGLASRRSSLRHAERIMSKVFFDVGMSLDGFIAGPHRGQAARWAMAAPASTSGCFGRRTSANGSGLSGGETSPDDDRIKEVFERTGAL